ncbi:hypothetical protein [Homoserinibacter sp. YIM 151385]|uniref:hypothetical protein n=1 Tax=Homoserinibacter sp. YIM 151385 TaxID=2985506 RepID=UPI0022F0A81A|nr:hypothetical protein [Homoserinibacter sp. YIM 151385]WBU38631.1 hypothetical protein OF852_03310 [Homoserinibacter sp. YIM 151385]
MTAVAQPRTATAVGTAGWLALGAVVAAAIDLGLVQLAIALGADAGFPPFQPAAWLSFTIGGLLLAHLGWRIVRRRARRPGRVLARLVPVLVVASLVPNAILLLAPVIPGTGVVAVLALMAMHLVVAGVAVAVSQRIAPVPHG